MKCKEFLLKEKCTDLANALFERSYQRLELVNNSKTSELIDSLQSIHQQQQIIETLKGDIEKIEEQKKQLERS